MLYSIREGFVDRNRYTVYGYEEKRRETSEWRGIAKRVWNVAGRCSLIGVASGSMCGATVAETQEWR